MPTHAGNDTSDDSDCMEDYALGLPKGLSKEQVLCAHRRDVEADLKAALGFKTEQTAEVDNQLHAE